MDPFALSGALRHEPVFITPGLIKKLEKEYEDSCKDATKGPTATSATPNKGKPPTPRNPQSKKKGRKLGHRSAGFGVIDDAFGGIRRLFTSRGRVERQANDSSTLGPGHHHGQQIMDTRITADSDLEVMVSDGESGVWYDRCSLDGTEEAALAAYDMKKSVWQKAG